MATILVGEPAMTLEAMQKLWRSFADKAQVEIPEPNWNVIKRIYDDSTYVTKADMEMVFSNLIGVESTPNQFPPESDYRYMMQEMMRKGKNYEDVFEWAMNYAIDGYPLH